MGSVSTTMVVTWVYILYGKCLSYASVVPHAYKIYIMLQ